MEAVSIQEILAENKAQLSTLAEHQGLGEDVLIRFWTVGQDDLDGCIAYLKAQTTILDPMKGTRWTRAGTWYAGDVDYKPGNVNPLVASGPNGLVWILYQQISKGDKIITIDEDCASYTKRKIIHTYNPAIPSGTAAAGQIVKVEATPTELGRERTVQETTTPKDQVTTANDVSMAAESEKVLHTEKDTPLVKPTATKGTIVHQTAQPTEAGNDRTMEETIVPKDQVATANDVSMAAEGIKVLHTENPTPLTKPTAAKGTIVHQTAQPTEAGNDRTMVETVVPKDQVAVSGEDTGLHSALRTVHTENPTEPAAPTRAAGTTKETEAIPTESGNARTTEIVKTPKKVSLAEYVARYSERSTDYIIEEHHDSNPPAITDQTADGIETAVLSHDLDDYLTHNYKKFRSVKKFPISDAENATGVIHVIYGDYELATSQVYSETLGRYWNDHTYVYQRKATHTMKFFKTASVAAAFIDGTFLTDNSGSHFAHTGEHEWMAIKVINTKSLVTTYDYLEPTS